MMSFTYLLRQPGLQSHLLRFSTSKLPELMRTIQQAQRKQQLSSPQIHPVLLQFLESDISSPSPYQHYSQVKQIFEQYITEITRSPNFQSYHPKTIIEQGKRLSEITLKLAQYPKFELGKDHVRNSYRIFCRLLNLRTDQQMASLLMFSLRVDPMAEQSVLYEQYLKFYLCQRWETLKAKYQLNLREESIGGLLKKIAASVVHRGFLRRTPEFERDLKMAYPTQVLKLILTNPSTSSSLLIRKLIYQQIFTPIAQRYESELHSNLYHPNNVPFWSTLNQNSDIFFHSSQILSKQTFYLRELYITLFLVLRQQGKHQPLYRWFGVWGAIEDRVLQLPLSQKAGQFRKRADEFVQVSQKDKLLEFVILDQNIFKLAKKFPQLVPDIMVVVTKKITPLTFYAYFNQLCECFPKWGEGLAKRISTKGQKNIFRLTPPILCLSLIRELKPPQIQLYNAIIDSIVNRQYEDQPSFRDIIAMLQIYSKHRQFSIEVGGDTNLSTLRVFLFRFIADTKGAMSREELRKVIDLISDLGDYETFSDGNGNYQMNIFEELERTVSTMQVGLGNRRQREE